MDNKLGESLSKEDVGVKSNENQLSQANYDSNVLEVSSRELKAAHRQKYQDPANFLQVLWNEAGPAVGSMKIMLEMIRKKIKGELASILAELTNTPSILINFLIEEVGEDANGAIEFIDKIAEQLNEYDGEESAGEQQGDPNVTPPGKGEGQN